jgi:hypothetical protein
MRNRWLLNLALLALVAGLALVLFYRPGQAPAPKAPLTALAPEAVTRLRLARPGQPDIELAKADGRWRLTRPFAARANRFNVENLLSLAGAPTEARLAADAATLAQYGLDKPLERVTLDDEEIAFGALHPFNDRQYVRYRDAVYLVPAHLYGPAGYTVGQLLDPRLLEPGTRITALRLPGFALTLTDGTWQRRPEDKGLSGDRLNDFVAEWQHASALSVERYRGAPVRARIELTVTHGAATRTLALGVLAEQPELVLHRADEGLEYHFPADLGRRLLTLAPEPK